MKAAGIIWAHPNPFAPDASGAGVTTLYWKSSGTMSVEVRVGSPDGPLVSCTSGSGTVTTGNWVRDCLTFYLQDRSNDAPLTSEHTLAKTTLRAEGTGAERLLDHAEEVRQQVQTGLRAFQFQFDALLRTYRSQRAWKAMLLLRKGYTLLVRNRSVAGFLKWLVSLHRESPAALAPYELIFPNLESYLPASLKFPFQPGGKGVENGEARGPKVPGQTKYDLIILPVLEFDFRFQRPQQLATQFARDGHRVFWVSPSRRLPPSSEKAYEVLPLRENLFEVHLRAPESDIYGGQLSEQHSSQLVGSLGQLYAGWTISESVGMVEMPFWRSVGNGLREKFGARLVFDCMDDWESMPLVSEFNRSEERSLVGECDLLIATSRQLQQKHAKVARCSLLVSNAADFDFFSRPLSTGNSLTGVPKPIVGYFGAIADWFDYDLFHKVVTSRPRYSFVLVGALGLEEHVIGEQIARFRGLPNVFLIGHKPYNDLPSYLHHFDACIIPFAINEVTRATDPVKIYEYFSQGKPVVATALPELSDRLDLVYVADDARDFARKLDLAVAERDAALPQRRTSYAARNTWRARVETLDVSLRQTFPLVSIFIVTHNSEVFVRPCLDSVIRNTTWPRYEVVIADNGSRDATVPILAEYTQAEPRIRVVRLAENTGFAAANNTAVRQASGDYLIFLNIDTIVTSGWVGRLVRHHQSDPSVGAVVPVTNWAGNEARINTEYTTAVEMEEFASALARKNMGRSLELQVAPFFCVLIPRTVWTRVGELDERFEPGMFEDDDYSLRLRRLNLRIITAEDCFVHHFGRGSFSKMTSEAYSRAFNENLERFEAKWGASWIPHTYRPSVRPEHIEHDPARFTAARNG